MEAQIGILILSLLIKKNKMFLGNKYFLGINIFSEIKVEKINRSPNRDINTFSTYSNIYPFKRIYNLFSESRNE